MRKIVRSRDLSEIGLESLEGVTGVAVGWAQGEVLPPHNLRDLGHLTKEERRARSRKSRVIRDHVGRGSFLKIPYVFHYEDFIKEFGRKHEVVEVVGALADFCVASAICDFIDQGHFAFVNPERAIDARSALPDFYVGQNIIREVFWDCPRNRCFIYGKDLIFYKK